MTLLPMEALLSLVDQRRVGDAISLIRGLLDDGMSPDDVIADVLVGAQVEVGRRWEAAEWSVAKEHAATGVVQAALGVVSSQIVVDGLRGTLIVCCVENEWHSVPARLVSERLRLRGWQSVFLGASTPAESLRDYVDSSDAVGVVASCQMAMSLPGLARAIEAVHEVGLPVVAGGAALGTDALRATNLGADAWTTDMVELDGILQAWSEEPVEHVAQALEDGGEHVRLLAAESDIIEAIASGLSVSWRTQAVDLSHTIKCLAGSVVAGDARVFHEYGSWLQRVVDARGGALTDILDVLRLLQGAMPAELTRAHATISETMAQLATSVRQA